MSHLPASIFDVAVVLGAAVDAEGRPSPALVRRVSHGVSLYRQGRAFHLLMSGGGRWSTHPEAQVMRHLAVAAGVPEEAVLTEERSSDTLENARFCKLIIEEKQWSRVLVVSEGYHLPRALYTFRRFGVRVEGAAAPGASGAALAAAHAREAGAFLCYLWRIERALRGSR